MAEPEADEESGAPETIVLRVPPTFTLHVVEAQDASLVGKVYRAQKACTIGRVESCEIHLPDASISRQHARVEVASGGYLVRDLGSANGTWVGDRRIQLSPIDHGDRFRIGTTVLEFRRDDSREGANAEDGRTGVLPAAETQRPKQEAHTGAGTDGRLEAEGEAVVVSGNTPFLLDDPSFVWLVEAGRLDVFTVAVKSGEPTGTRSHFVSVEKGSGAFGMDLEAYGGGSGFLASGKAGTRLRKIPLARLRQLVAEGHAAARIAALLDTWISALSAAVVRGIPVPEPDEELEEGRASTLAFQKRARARKGVVWAGVGGGSVLFIGLSEVDTAADTPLFPVTRDGWVESARDGVTLKVLPTTAVLSRPEIWRGLELFHRVLCECEFINKKLAAVDEFNRLTKKSEHAASARDAAMQEIGDVLAGADTVRKDTHEFLDADPVFRASRLVCGGLGLTAVIPPESAAERTFEDNVQAVALASRLRTRQVALRGDWWREDHGPLLGRIGSTGAPVALLPVSPTAYDLVDPGTGKRRRVTRAFAETLAPFGTVFYRRFPDGPLTARDIAAFGAWGLRRDFLMLVGMGLGMGALGSLTPYITGQVLDRGVLRGERGLLVQLSAALFAAAISTAAFKIAQSVAAMRVQGRMDYSIQAALWDRLLDLPTTFFRGYTAGDLADRAQGIDAIWQLLSGAGVGAILGTLSSLFYVVMMLTYSVPLAITGLLVTLVFVAFTTLANLRQLGAQRAQMAIIGKLTGLVNELIQGVPKLRVSGAEDHGFHVWARGFAEQRRIAFRAGRIRNAVAVFNAGFPVLSSIAVFATLARLRSESGSAGLTTGEFVAFSASLALFLAAVQSLSDASLNLLRVVPIWERLTPILETPPEVDESKSVPGAIQGHIDISHVSFRYTADSPLVLDDVSLTIKAGEFVALVGASGCGKSTLMRLMLGFEKPEKGSISYDGQDLSTLDVRLVRRQLGVVLQDSEVLPADIYRNIVGTTSRTIDEAWEAAEAAGFAEDIRSMPMGMHTYVNEGGSGFSGGQRQRLMIARAVVNRPRVIFLDEATSALDNRTQATVTESLRNLRATRVAIAHRLSTILHADRICYLEGGKVREMGTFDELIRLKGRFCEMARRQEA